jgi:hypothetical protein
MATTLIVLFNLKDGVDPSAYETWAKNTDLATVRKLSSVNSFEVFKTSGLLMSEDTPPYAYVELIEVNDMEVFGGEVSTETMQKVAGEFAEFADNPLFMISGNIEG